MTQRRIAPHHAAALALVAALAAGQGFAQGTSPAPDDHSQHGATTSGTGTNETEGNREVPEDGITAHEGDGHADQLDCADLLAREDADARNNQVGGAQPRTETGTRPPQDTQQLDECRAQQNPAGPDAQQR